MLSNTCKTAIKAVIYLASKHETPEKSALREIAEKIEASEHTVGKILQLLVKQDVINSTKGPSGGFYLDKAQVTQPLINIVEAIDGKQVFKECGLGLSRCSDKHPCPIHHAYKPGRDIMENLFKEKKVADLCAGVNSGLSYLIG
jgi:Rrf2 family protein